ncbi:MAG: glycosyltransferase [Solirubrobacterales bacterium]|jgi:glycosyltransferase involved in cell wall biosynthesis
MTMPQVAEGSAVLLVSHSYPPRPSPASRRPFGLAKYLRRLGYRVIVLTSDAWGDSSATEPEGDLIQARDLIGSRLNWRQRNIGAYEGRRGASYSSQQSMFGRMLVPDVVGVTWLPFALGPALALRDEVDAVITTSGPESTHLVGVAMRRRGVPWVADLRDGWRFEPYREFPLEVEELVDAQLERRVLSQADRLTAVSEPIAADLRDRLGLRAISVPNGYDPEEVPAATSENPLAPDRHSIVYTGRLATGGRTPDALIAALQALGRRGAPELERLEVVLAGPLTDGERAALDGAGVGDSLRTVGTLARDQTLRLQRDADSLLLLTAGSRRGEATGKLFEYLFAERPILVLGERTEAARIVEDTKAGVVIPSDDPERIADALVSLVRGETDGFEPAILAGARASYAHSRMAERMAAVIEAARTE